MIWIPERNLHLSEKAKEKCTVMDFRYDNQFEMSFFFSDP